LEDIINYVVFLRFRVEELEKLLLDGVETVKGLQVSYASASGTAYLSTAMECGHEWCADVAEARSKSKER
jgi:hypothetical protein